VKRGGRCDGFAGYFRTDLFTPKLNNNNNNFSIYLSTHPMLGQKDMYSWFALYFPILYPVFVRKGILLFFYNISLLLFKH
jgi:hypothetical protein